VNLRDLHRVVQDLRAVGVHPLTEVMVVDPSTRSRTDVAGAFYDNGFVSIVLELPHAQVAASEAMEERE
jgi:hypothetical protein